VSKAFIESVKAAQQVVSVT